MTATSKSDCITTTTGLYVAFELGWGKWKLAMTPCVGQSPRMRDVNARDLGALELELAKAKARFGLAADAPVFTCYEAGRDGFWLHRYLTDAGVDNLVVDAASIEVKRRKRRAKNDRLDAQKLVGMLLRWHGGEKKVWSVVQVPSVADEDRRQLHRELLTLKGERTEHVNRIKGLLAAQGLALKTVKQDFPATLAEKRLWDGSELPADLRQRLLREWQRWQLAEQQIGAVQKERQRRVVQAPEACHAQVRKLLAVRGIGVNAAWLFSMEFFAWRKIVNRRQVGALAGLVPTPYQSGGDAREQGISKAGNRRLRALAIEIAWCWLRYQTASKLSRWYRERFGGGSKRMRKIGITALARKLLVGLWRYLETGELPEGAVLETWEHKLRLKPREAG